MSTALTTGLSALLAGAAWWCRPVPPHRAPRQASTGRQVDAPPAAHASPAAHAEAHSTAHVGVPDVVLIDLVVAALGAGLPAASAVAAARWAAAPSARAAPGDDLPALPDAVARAFALAERTGASAAELLRRAAADERAARRAAVAVAASRLGVRLVVPLGLAVLPAFVLLGVVPVVLGLAQQLVSG